MVAPEALQKVAEGREAELFAWTDSAILRLLRDAGATASNERQRIALEAARASGVPVPAVYEVVTVMGRPGLVLERIEGIDLLTAVGQQPWRVLSIGRTCGTLQATLHAAPAPPELPALRDVLRRDIEGSLQVPADGARRALATLAELPDGDHLCHGDFHPGNVIGAPDGPVVIDWASATRGDPDADIARTVLILRLGEPPPGASPALRALALVGRRLLIASHLRAYRRHRSVDRTRLAQWQVVLAAHRLAVGIPSERRALLKLLAPTPT